MQSQKVSGRTYETETGLMGHLGVGKQDNKEHSSSLHLLSSWMGGKSHVAPYEMISSKMPLRNHCQTCSGCSLDITAICTIAV